MKLTFQWKCVGAILLLGVYCCSASTLASNSSVQNHNTRRAPKDLNLAVPLTKILNSFVELKGLNVTLLFQSVIKIITECLPAGESGSFDLPLAINLSYVVEMHKNKHVIYQETLLPNQMLMSNYCKSEDFRKIHAFLWHDDIQFRDLLNFMHRFGIREIYIVFKGLYQANGCPDDLIDDIPTEPTTLTRSKSGQSGSSRSNIRNEIISSHSNKENPLMMPLQTECNIVEILTNLLKSGALKLLQFIETLLEQINTDASLHFWIGKIQEPIKGRSFRDCRLLPEIRRLFCALNEAITKNDFVITLLALLKQLLGISLEGINIVEFLVTIVEMILWQNFDYVEPYNCTLVFP